MGETGFNLPTDFAYETKFPVRHADARSAITATGAYVSHVTYENMVLLINEAFDLFLASNGDSKWNFAGSNIIVPKMEVEFKSEVKAGEVLTFRIQPTNFGNKSFDLITAVIKENGELAALSKTVLIFFDYKEKKTMPVPEAFRNRYQK
ncbi:thioesterase-like family protein [Leptospira ryugenii]|uniref:Thioesterase-like family protein n=1 Tax=Leptospira ryugenii TaxID=1917863 RepID=A0A2P2E268_9LEPT|nr:thioesterase family protein [Leptospira ryugenii]GBF50906.1 thioesterase-like family protein [Leptospira ryugenii]